MIFQVCIYVSLKGAVQHSAAGISQLLQAGDEMPEGLTKRLHSGKT